MTIQEKKTIYRLIDELPESDLPTARRLLEGLHALADPVTRALRNAPEDDEPLTAEDETAITEAEEAIQRGEMVPHKEMRRRLLEP